MKSVLGSVVICMWSMSSVISSASPAAAQTQSGSFLCRASAVQLLGLEPVVANPSGRPCRDDSRTGLRLPLPSLSVGSTMAATAPLPGGRGATSRAQVVGSGLAALGLQVDLAEAEATVTCEAGQARLSGGSRVVGLRVNGRAVASSERADIPLAGGTLHLNRTVEQGGTLTRRAVELETALGRVILGEASAGAVDAPCGQRRAAITVIKVATFESPQLFPFTGDLGSFSLRDAEGTAGGDRVTFSKEPGRYRITELDPVDPVHIWRLADVHCVDPDGGSTTDLGMASARVDLDAGEQVVCTFTNRDLGNLAGAGGNISNPAGGVDPVQVKQDAPTGGGTIESPLPPTRPPPEVPEVPEVAKKASASILPATVVGLPLLALLAAGLWLLLVVGKRRRREDEKA